jgi:hypothetical protein
VISRDACKARPGPMIGHISSSFSRHCHRHRNPKSRHRRGFTLRSSRSAHCEGCVVWAAEWHSRCYCLHQFQIRLSITLVIAFIDERHRPFGQFHRRHVARCGHLKRTKFWRSLDPKQTSPLESSSCRWRQCIDQIFHNGLDFVACCPATQAKADRPHADLWRNSHSLQHRRQFNTAGVTRRTG